MCRNVELDTEVCSFRLLELFLEVLLALRDVHRRGIVWLDVKLNNILLKCNEQGRELAILADFGESLELPQGEESVRIDRPRGCVQYMAPEVLRAES